MWLRDVLLFVVGVMFLLMAATQYVMQRVVRPELAAPGSDARRSGGVAVEYVGEFVAALSWFSACSCRSLFSLRPPPKARGFGLAAGRLCRNWMCGVRAPELFDTNGLVSTPHYREARPA